MSRVKDKVVLITGAGSGVGRACMRLFVSEGAKVVGAGRTLNRLEQTLDLVVEGGGEGMVIAADMSIEADVKNLVEQIVKSYGRIDILVHAAGVGYSWEESSPGSMADVVNVPLEKWREVININLDGYFLMCREVISVMKAHGGGAIVGVASISGLQGLEAAHAYTAAKAGMINLTRSLCVSYAQDGIRANCIAPGFIDTPMVASLANVFKDADVAKQITPMCRPGTAEEMAYGCLYLASDEASYCNGTVLVIDGGTTARQ